MQADIIAIGSELTSGAKLDTNSQWLSQQLAEIGIVTLAHTTVADNLDEMIGVLRSAVKRSDLVLITGGLGPTRDDLTRHMIAGVANASLQLHEPSLAHIRSLFVRRGRAMPDSNVVQAQFPEGAQPIPNPRGTAPGIWIDVARKSAETACQVVAMPGVPSEMKRMFASEVFPRLPHGSRVMRQARINCFGLGESSAEEKLGDLTARGRWPEVGITVHEATITLRIGAMGASVEECAQQIAQTRAVIEQRLGTAVFGKEDDELQHVLVRLLEARGAKLAVVEMGTGGLLADRMTDVPSHQNCFRGSLVAHCVESLRSLLDVSLDENASSEQTARAVAAACRKRLNADFALAITECPTFDPDDVNAEAPVAWIALAGRDFEQVHRHTLVGDPSITKSRAVKQALNMLRIHLLKSVDDPTRSSAPVKD